MFNFAYHLLVLVIDYILSDEKQNKQQKQKHKTKQNKKTQQD